MSANPRQTAARRGVSGAQGVQLVCAWLHLTPRECYTLARASSDAALEMAVGYGLDRPVARRMSESEYWYLFDVHGAYGKTHGD